ncbi:MAG: WhiB family transcriptional regulator [Ilumatobacteraceae bacterium]
MTGAAHDDDDVALAELLATLHPPAWHADAACREHPELTWFPARGGAADVAAAVAICDTCLVRDECLADADQRHERLGIWGGTTARQRRRRPGQRPGATT